MSCGGGNPTFRLLDAFVGWDHDPMPDGKFSSHENLTGLHDPEGLRLKLVTDGTIDPNSILEFIPPPRLSRGCVPCDWYLVTPVPPAPRLLLKRSCPGQWLPLFSPDCDPNLLIEPVAISARGHNIAVSDIGANKVWVFSQGGERLIAAIGVKRPGPVAFTSYGELLVTSKDLSRIMRFNLFGEPLGTLAAPVPGTIENIAVSEDCRIWVVTKKSDGTRKLWFAAQNDVKFSQATIEALAKAFKPTGLTAASEIGFSFEEHDSGGTPVTKSYSWYGRPVDPSKIKRQSPPSRNMRGQLLTEAIDSGIPRCRWHRVRIDADVPPGTTLTVSVATNEEEIPATRSETVPDKVWKNFPVGKPHQKDWRPRSDEAATINSSLDFLIDQPPGRYLFLRLRLTSDGANTPVVRRIRLDFPRLTSLEFLPPVYRESPDAEDFTERFLSLFDASIAEVDEVIERAPALLDVTGIPDEVLAWLGSFLDVSFDRAWSPEQMRRILEAVPGLYRRRGTVAGLAEAIKLVFEVDPAIQEMAAERSWGGIGGSTHLRTVRLFGKSRSRFRLGSSPVGNVPLRSFGDPNMDPLSAQAYRFRVLVPPNADISAGNRHRLESFVVSQKPAHTVASIHVGGGGFRVGNSSSVGVDTVFGTLPPPVLRENIRLGRSSVLWHGPGGPRKGFAPGLTAVAGVTTILE